MQSAPSPPGYYEGSVVIENPPCPYVGEIPGGLRYGTMITVKGMTPLHHDTFSVNLCVAPCYEPMPNMALHVNPRFNENTLVCNSMINDHWGSEERSRNMPLKKGKPFEISILVASNEFKIALNGGHVMCFGHRMPKEMAPFLVVKGGIQMNFIRITSGCTPPPASIPSQHPAIYKPECPYVGEIPGGLRDGTIITVQGMTPLHHDTFSVNLCVAPCYEPMPDVALHVNPRFNINTLVCNSMINDSWGSEVRFPNMPLKKGKPFEIIILVASNEFKIALNGGHFMRFGHRMPKEMARFLVVKGGIQMNFIRIASGCTPPPAPTPSQYPAIYNPENSHIFSNAMQSAPPPPSFYEGPVVIENPPCPYVGEIPGGLRDGTTITVQGMTPLHQNIFSVNLCVAPCYEPMPDMALHLNPRFNDNALICNSLINDSWGSEVRSTPMPLKKGKPFEIIILVASNEFKIALNGKHFMCFGHRMPKQHARFLVVKGGIQMNFIRIASGYTPPPAPTPSQHPAIYNPIIPTVTEIPGFLYPQKMIQISGFPKSFNPSRFTINLKNAYEIALHFDVRFTFGDSNHYVVVRNASVNGDWGEEEDCQSFFPFKAGVGFDILILVEPHCFMVAVNNQHFCAFNHRLLPLSRVNLLEITGDVQIKMIQF